MRVIKSKSALKLQTVIRLIKGVKVIRVRLTPCKQAAHEAKPPQPNIEHRQTYKVNGGRRGVEWCVRVTRRSYRANAATRADTPTRTNTRHTSPMPMRVITCINTTSERDEGYQIKKRVEAANGHSPD